MFKEININAPSMGFRTNTRISLIGSKKQIEKGEQVIFSLPLDGGTEPRNRVIIQKALDENTGMPKISYDGNFVYPTKGYVSALKKMRKSGSIASMNEKVYEFIHLHFDVAHYDRSGYISTYDGRYDLMMRAICRDVIRYGAGNYTDILNILILSGLWSDAGSLTDTLCG